MYKLLLILLYISSCIQLGRAFEHTVQVHPLGQFHSSNYYALSMFGALPSNLEHLRFSLDRLRYSYNPVDFTYIFQESGTHTYCTAMQVNFPGLQLIYCADVEYTMSCI